MRAVHQNPQGVRDLLGRFYQCPWQQALFVLLDGARPGAEQSEVRFGSVCLWSGGGPTGVGNLLEVQVGCRPRLEGVGSSEVPTHSSGT